MDRALMDKVVDEHLRAEEAEDIPAILATLSDDVVQEVHPSPPTGVMHGKEMVQGFYEHLFQDLTEITFNSVARWYGEDFVVDQSLVTATAKGHPFGLDGQGKHVEMGLLHIFQIADGKITLEAGWLDYGALAAQLS